VRVGRISVWRLPKRLGKRGGQWQLVGDAGTREPDREGADRALRVAREQREQDRRVDAAGEEQAPWHVAAHVLAHHVRHEVVELGECVGLVDRARAHRCRRPVRGAPRDGAVGDHDHLARQQPLDAGERRRARRRALVLEVLAQPVRRGRRRALGQRQQRLDLGGESYALCVRLDEQRLDPQPVAREHQITGRAVV